MDKVIGFFKKVGSWLKNHAPSKRRLIQVYAALLFNANLKGFFTGTIYTGSLKNLCSPGLNCYSCPGASAACPLGALQDSLANSDTRAPYYILGILALFGLMLARTICGFLCPVGLGQELLYKIKTPKVKKGRVTRVFSYFKYVLLAVFVVAIPFIFNGIPAFCKYVCPAGTLEGAVGLMSHPDREGLIASLKFLFSWKFGLLVSFIVACIFFYRFFCRFICPLGAIYGFFNKFALIGVKLDRDKCVDCGMCIQTCKMDIRHVSDHECINCGECIPVCPTKAISWKGSQIFVRGITSPALAAQGAAGEEIAVAPPLTALLSEGTAAETESAAPEVVIPVQTEETPLPEMLFNSRSQSEAAMNAPLERSAETAAADAQASCGVSDGEQSEKAPLTAEQRVRRRKFFAEFTAWIAALIVLIGALVYYNFVLPTEKLVVLVIGTKSPDVTLTNYDSLNENQTFSVSACEGKVTVINFWYTTCSPCVAELPYFIKVCEEYDGEINMAVVHATLETENVQAFLDRTEWTDANGARHAWSESHVMFALDTAEQDAAGKFGVGGAYPTTVILDKEGMVRFVWNNSLEESELRAQIELAMQY